MKFEVDEKLVQPIVRDQIATAVASALGNQDDIIKKMVEMALRQKVNSEGKIENYDNYNKYDFVEVVAANAIREAAKEALKKAVEAKKPEIQAAVERELSKKPAQMACAIMKAFIDGVSSGYTINAEFSFKPRS